MTSSPLSAILVRMTFVYVTFRILNVLGPSSNIPIFDCSPFFLPDISTSWSCWVDLRLICLSQPHTSARICQIGSASSLFLVGAAWNGKAQCIISSPPLSSPQNSPIASLMYSSARAASLVTALSCFLSILSNSFGSSRILPCFAPLSSNLVIFFDVLSCGVVVLPWVLAHGRGRVLLPAC